MKNEPSLLIPPRKKAMKFQPKIPTRRAVKSQLTKTEPSEPTAEFVDTELLSKLKNTRDGQGRWIRNGKNVSPAHVAFGDGDPSKARSFRNPKSSIILKEPQGSMNVPALFTEPEEDIYEEYEELEEQVDYSSYYPTTLPLSKPNSETQDALAVKELGEASNCLNNESSINAAAELGLEENKKEPELILFQLPANLPLWKRPAADEHASGPSHRRKGEDPKGCRMQELPAGFMGKLRVYKSGAVKLKLGDSEFDVSPGTKTLFAEEVAAINTRDKDCCILGNVTKHAVITPDVDSLLNSIENMGVSRR